MCDWRKAWLSTQTGVPRDLDQGGKTQLEAKRQPGRSQLPRNRLLEGAGLREEQGVQGVCWAASLLVALPGEYVRTSGLDYRGLDN